MQLTNLILVLFISLAAFNGFANEENLTEAENNFNQGQIFYKDGEIDAAINEFTNAISKSPNISNYHHWLAKSYGELAEISGWLKAMRLAEDSRDSLKRAVELDPENISALTDLMKYYQEAPRFLGGSNKKAKDISIQLEVLNDKNTNSLEKPEVNSDEQNDQNPGEQQPGDSKMRYNGKLHE